MRLKLRVRFSCFESKLLFTRQGDGLRVFHKLLSHCLFVRPYFPFLFVLHLCSQTPFHESALFIFLDILKLKVSVLESKLFVVRCVLDVLRSVRLEQIRCVARANRSKKPFDFLPLLFKTLVFSLKNCDDLIARVR